MESIPVSKFRASLKEYLDRMEAGEVINVNGLEIARFNANQEVVQGHVQEVVQADVQIDYEKLASLIAEKLNIPISGELNNSKESDFKERREEAIIKTIELAPSGEVTESPFVMVQRWRVEPDCFADEMNQWIPVPAHTVPKGVETRPYVEEEKVELPKYDLGVSMKPQAKMNDGSNPIPKPVKKKKNEK